MCRCTTQHQEVLKFCHTLVTIVLSSARHITLLSSLGGLHPKNDQILETELIHAISNPIHAYAPKV